MNERSTKMLAIDAESLESLNAEVNKWRTAADNMAKLFEDAKRRIRELEAQLAEAHAALEDAQCHGDWRTGEIELLRKQLAEANETTTVSINALQVWIERAEAAEARAEAMRAALETVEYVPCAAEGMDGFSHCPWCEQFSDEPHAEDCARQAALAPTPAEPPQVFPWKTGDMLRAELEEKK